MFPITKKGLRGLPTAVTLIFNWTVFDFRIVLVWFFFECCKRYNKSSVYYIIICTHIGF